MLLLCKYLNISIYFYQYCDLIFSVIINSKQYNIILIRKKIIVQWKLIIKLTFHCHEYLVIISVPSTWVHAIVTFGSSVSFWNLYLKTTVVKYFREQYAKNCFSLRIWRVSMTQILFKNYLFVSKTIEKTIFYWILKLDWAFE
jgi:hypothetical protein